MDDPGSEDLADAETAHQSEMDSLKEKLKQQLALVDQLRESHGGGWERGGECCASRSLFFVYDEYEYYECVLAAFETRVKILQGLRRTCFYLPGVHIYAWLSRGLHPAFITGQGGE